MILHNIAVNAFVQKSFFRILEDWLGIDLCVWGYRVKGFSCFAADTRSHQLQFSSFVLQMFPFPVAFSEFGFSPGTCQPHCPPRRCRLCRIVCNGLGYWHRVERAGKEGASAPETEPVAARPPPLCSAAPWSGGRQCSGRSQEPTRSVCQVLCSAQLVRYQEDGKTA